MKQYLAIVIVLIFCSGLMYMQDLKFSKEIELIKGKMAQQKTPPLPKSAKELLNTDLEKYKSNQARNTITKHSSEIQICYNKLVEANKSPQKGRVNVDWTINPEGNVITPGVISSTFNDKKFESCIINKIKKISFPVPPQGKAYYLSHIFNFKSQSELNKEQLNKAKAIIK